VGSLRSPHKICIKVKKYLHEMTPEPLEIMVQTIDLFTYSIIICILFSNDDSKIHMCKYLVQSKCIIDFIQCMINVKPLKYDIMIHHTLTIILVQASVHCEYNTNIYDITTINYITKTLITTEVSALFLTVNNLLKHINWTDTVLYFINRNIFIFTFLYYTTYQLCGLFLFVMRKRELLSLNIPLLNDSEPQIYMKLNTIIAIVCLTGIIALNFAWSAVLIERLYSIIHLNIQYYN